MAGYTFSGKHLAVLRDVVEASKMPAPDVALPWELLESLGRLLGCDEMVFLGMSYAGKYFYFDQQSRDNNQEFNTRDESYG